MLMKQVFALLRGRRSLQSVKTFEPEEANFLYEEGSMDEEILD